MGLLNRFKNTIFLKEDSDLEKQLEDLKNIRGVLENTEEIDKDIRLLEYGIAGEKEIAFELKNAHIGMYVLHDVTYEYEGNKAQIDYLIFTKGYFYIIECKNLYGNISVDSNGQFYREYECHGKRIKEAIYSPYTQAQRHQDMLKKVWSINHGTISNLIFGNQGKDFFRPIVVLSNSKSFLNTKYAPKDIRKDIIRADQLVSYIKKDLDSLNILQLNTEKNIKDAAEVWLSRTTTNTRNIADKYKKEAANAVMKHKEQVSSVNDVNVEKELKAFRKEKSTKMNVPAYYIFTDEEMNSIIKLMPKTIDELKNSNILSDIKVKCHGEEIIEIINK